MVKAEKEVAEEIEFYVSDSRGGIITKTLTIHTMPFWTCYKNVVIGILLIFVVLSCIYFVMLKKKTLV